MQILSGIRVIDAATYIAAPAAASVLSDFGAEVIKIERPPRGDPYRYLHHVPGLPVSDRPYCFILDGRNRKSIALNLAGQEGREVLLKLVESADVFITNYQPQLIARFRLSYDELRTRNKRLIYAQLSGYGEAGEEADKPGYDMTGYWARSGLMDYIHNTGCDPAQSPSGFGDHPTAMSLFGAIMLALYQRERTGNGMKVGTSLMANGAWSNSVNLQAALCGATRAERRTRAHPVNPLVNHYISSDGRRFIFCLLDPAKDWSNLCHAVGHAEWLTNDRFQTPVLRQANSEELVSLLDAVFARRPMKEWADLFQQHDVIWGPVPSSDEVARDKQMHANGVFVDFADSPFKTVSNPIALEGYEKTLPRIAPEIGQHTVEILKSAGYAEETIRDLLQRGVVFTPAASLGETA